MALTPAAVPGCVNRGLPALAVALVSGCLALREAAAAAKGRVRGDANAFWRVVSTLVLTIPVVAMIAMA